jgi:hypothetical protein
VLERVPQELEKEKEKEDTPTLPEKTEYVREEKNVEKVEKTLEEDVPPPPSSETKEEEENSSKQEKKGKKKKKNGGCPRRIVIAEKGKPLALAKGQPAPKTAEKKKLVGKRLPQRVAILTGKEDTRTIEFTTDGRDLAISVNGIFFEGEWRNESRTEVWDADQNFVDFTKVFIL